VGQPEEDTNIDLPQRGKYNFHEITRHLYTHNFSKEDKEGNYTRDLSIKKEIIDYRRLKSLRQIERIGDFNEEFGKFNYYIERPEEEYSIDFIDSSMVITNSSFKIDYFRDIGEPSRDIMNYTIRNCNTMKRKDDEDNLDPENFYDQEKRELLYLYFLKEEELKINKAGLNFSDLINISMGRITPNNSHMCIRSEKVTKAQYQKLLKKMERYDMRENEGGKPKVDGEVCMNDDDDVGAPTTGEEVEEVKEVSIDPEKLIEDINQIKKEVKRMEDPSSGNDFNRPNFNNEIFKKLEILLNMLYDSIADKVTKRYPLHEIRSHLGEIEGTNELGYDRIRLLWFIANSYEEVFNKQRKRHDLRDMACLKTQPTPILNRYKGDKLIHQDAIQTKKVYGFFHKQTPARSPLPKSSLKSVRNTAKTPTKPLSKTPTKTPSRSDTKQQPLSTTGRKMSTARK
jgi:hypothetical protein